MKNSIFIVFTQAFKTSLILFNFSLVIEVLQFFTLNDIFFQWNKVYVLDTEQGALIKRIKKGSEGHILIVSDNKDYEPVELHLSKIHAIAIVVGVIRLE